MTIMWIKQCHKPAMTGNGKHTTYENGDLGIFGGWWCGMVMYTAVSIATSAGSWEACFWASLGVQMLHQIHPAWDSPFKRKLNHWIFDPFWSGLGANAGGLRPCRSRCGVPRSAERRALKRWRVWWRWACKLGHVGHVRCKPWDIHHW